MAHHGSYSDPHISEFFKQMQAKAEPPESLFRKLERLTEEERGERANLFHSDYRGPLLGVLLENDTTDVRDG